MFKVPPKHWVVANPDHVHLARTKRNMIIKSIHCGISKSAPLTPLAKWLGSQVGLRWHAEARAQEAASQGRHLPGFCATGCRMLQDFWHGSGQGLEDCHSLDKGQRLEPWSLNRVLLSEAAHTSKVSTVMKAHSRWASMRHDPGTNKNGNGRLIRFGMGPYPTNLARTHVQTCALPQSP